MSNQLLKPTFNLLKEIVQKTWFNVPLEKYFNNPVITNISFHYFNDLILVSVKPSNRCFEAIHNWAIHCVMIELKRLVIDKIYDEI